MEIVIDPLAPRDATPRIQAAVVRVLSGRRLEDVRVYVSRPHPGRWSVFITGLKEHPLEAVESIEAELERTDYAGH
jgi:hypothetical protein